MLKIVLPKNGPIAITDGKKTIALCRCGLSSNKPQCDGKHKDCGFDLPAAEVKVGEHLSIEVDKS